MGGKVPTPEDKFEILSFSWTEAATWTSTSAQLESSPVATTQLVVGGSHGDHVQIKKVPYGGNSAKREASSQNYPNRTFYMKPTFVLPTVMATITTIKVLS